MSVIKVGVDYTPLNVLVGKFINQKQVTSNLEQNALNVTNGDVLIRNLKTDNCDLEKYKTHITNKTK